MTVNPSSTSCPSTVDFIFFSSYLLITFYYWLVSQATSQTDLENWVTAIHSACASLFAKKLGKEDTVRLLKNQTKSLFQKIDMDSKMKKMAELQLSIVSDPKNRKAIENQVLENVFFYESLFIVTSCFGLCLCFLGLKVIVLGTAGTVLVIIARVIQSSAGGKLLKAAHQTVLFYEHKVIPCFFCENVINFHCLC